MLHGQDIDKGLKSNLLYMLITGVAVLPDCSWIHFCWNFTRKAPQPFIRGIWKIPVMLKLWRYNKNIIFKQLDDITTPAMILKPDMWNNDRCDTFLNSHWYFFTLHCLLEISPWLSPMASYFIIASAYQAPLWFSEYVIKYDMISCPRVEGQKGYLAVEFIGNSSPSKWFQVMEIPRWGDIVWRLFIQILFR